ncbi:MAG: dipeptidase [Paracoccaceae bacterium]
MTDLIPVFDGHNDTLLKLELAARAGAPCEFATGAPKLDIDLPRAREAGFAGGFFAMFTPTSLERLSEKFDPEDQRHFAALSQEPALRFTLAMFARVRRLARDLPRDIDICGDTDALRAAMAGGRIAILPHIEGAECIDTDLNALEILHAAGLRSLGLVWSRHNAFGHGAPMKAQPELDPGEGLTDAGRALVAECERLGVMVDLSHLTEAGFWDVAKIATRPLIATHSNVHAISPSARNLTDRQLAAVAETGGVVGLNFHCGFLREDCRMNSDTPLETMLRHLDHLIGALGEHGVALGSDFDGCLLPAEIKDVTGLPRLVAAMRQAEYGEDLIARICSKNWLDALDRAGVGALPER